MPDVKRVLRVNPSTMHRELQGEGVLLQLDTGKYFGLDEMGQRMWELIVAHGDFDRVVQALLEEYDVEREVLAADLTRLVDELRASSLIEIETVGAPEKD